MTERRCRMTTSMFRPSCRARRRRQCATTNTSLGVSVRSAVRRSGRFRREGVASVEGALASFTMTEQLPPEYKCQHCTRAVRASKQLTLLNVPPVFVIHLKRCDFDFQLRTQSKISTHISFGETLDLCPFLTPEVGGRRRALVVLFSWARCFWWSSPRRCGLRHRRVRLLSHSESRPRWVRSRCRLLVARRERPAAAAAHAAARAPAGAAGGRGDDGGGAAGHRAPVRRDRSRRHLDGRRPLHLLRAVACRRPQSVRRLGRTAVVRRALPASSALLRRALPVGRVGEAV